MRSRVTSPRQRTVKPGPGNGCRQTSDSGRPTLAQGGDRQASRALWQALAQTPDNEWLQRDALRRLLQLDALDAIADLNARVRRYREAGGRPPFTWQSLVRGRWLREVPPGPPGVPYELGPYSGDVGLNDTSPLHPLPAEPPPIAPR